LTDKNILFAVCGKEQANLYEECRADHRYLDSKDDVSKSGKIPGVGMIVPELC
jgi:hypothetical protein